MVSPTMRLVDGKRARTAPTDIEDAEEADVGDVRRIVRALQFFVVSFSRSSSADVHINSL